jgi:hypothetical protein
MFPSCKALTYIPNIGGDSGLFYTLRSESIADLPEVQRLLNQGNLKFTFKKSEKRMTCNRGLNQQDMFNEVPDIY